MTASEPGRIVEALRHPELYVYKPREPGTPKSVAEVEAEKRLAVAVVQKEGGPHE